MPAVRGAPSPAAGAPRQPFLVGGAVMVLAFVAELNQTSCSTPCAGGCLGDTDAEFYMSCPSADLMAVNLSGPCAMAHDASAPAAYDFRGNALFFRTGYAGVCHVELTFSNSFVYSTEINFQQQP